MTTALATPDTPQQPAEKKKDPRVKAIKLGPIPVGIRPNYKEESKEALQAEWDASSPEEKAFSIRILESRLSHRGRSANGLQVLMALVATVQGAIVVFNVTTLFNTKDWVWGWSAIVAVFALVCLTIGVIPLRKEIFPNRRDDEGMDALMQAKNYGFGYFLELRGRSSTQRLTLWRSRLWFGLSVILTIISLMMVNGGIFAFMLNM